LFTMSWSVAHIIGHTLGLKLVARWGYPTTWTFFACMLLAAVGMLIWLERMLNKEKSGIKA